MTPTGDTPIKVVAGLIYRDERLLVCQRRADGAFPLKWEFPGGKVEGGEAEVAALRRELCEELAIEVREAKFFCRHDHSYKNGLRVSLRFYNVCGFDGEPQNLVFERISWLKLSDLEQLDFLDGDRPLIAELAAGEGAAVLGR
ncbi:MAG: (deoxy)nucleoside triphosphate pyrophosphohydrolase [Candidatus Binatia bacterium]